ncbi:MAG: aldose 1-epimerase [Planctomycetes bacterium]|nr:aldose 1-epimerase [Planctomycetota bacterium]
MSAMPKVHTFEAEINGHKMAAGVLAGFGANLVSLQVDGHDYIYCDEAVFEQTGEEFTGCFVMFPTPCRIPGGTYEFEGRRITQNKRGRLVPIHGLVRDEAFELESIADGVRLSLDITPDHPVYEAFPFAGLLSLEMKLIERGLSYSFCFENRGDSAAPVGFGVHPYWRIPGREEDTWVQVPCDRMLDQVDLIPTGTATPVGGTDMDLRELRSLGGLRFDDVYVARSPGAPAIVEFRDIGRRVLLRADDVFTHQIVYHPSGAPFVCVENLTCAPNAVNLQSIDPKISGFRTVEAGRSFSGTTRFVVEDIR